MIRLRARPAVHPRSSSPKPTLSRTRAPRQQAELLEHHRDSQPADPAQRRRIAFRDVDDGLAVCYQHLAAGDGVEPIGGAQQRGFAGARQSHEHRYLTPGNAEIGVGHADDDAGLLGYLGARAARVQQRRAPPGSSAAAAPLRLRAEQDVDVAKLDALCSWRGALFRRAADPVEHDRQQHDDEAGLESHADLHGVECAHHRARPGRRRPPARR